MAEYRYTLCSKGVYLLHRDTSVRLLTRLPRVLKHASLFRIAKTVGARALSGSERTSDVVLPVKGTLCLRAQIGFLVLDFDRSLVFHVFSPKVDAATFAARQQMFSGAAAFSFAPKLRKVSASEQWLATDYIEGREWRHLVAANERQFIATLEDEVLPCLQELATSAEMAVVDAQVYVGQLAERIKEEIAARWPDARWLFRFVQKCVNRVAGTQNLILGKSHGDFVHPNLIGSKVGLRVIDWNTIGSRSIVHDVHAFVFSQIYWGPKFTNRTKLLSRSVESFSALLPSGASMCEGVGAMTAYRYCYYLERISMKLGRRNSAGSPSLLEREISMFESFEDEFDME